MNRKSLIVAFAGVTIIRPENGTTKLKCCGVHVADVSRNDPLACLQNVLLVSATVHQLRGGSFAERLESEKLRVGHSNLLDRTLDHRGLMLGNFLARTNTQANEDRAFGAVLRVLDRM